MAFQINYIWIRTNVFGFGRLLIDSSRSVDRCHAVPTVYSTRWASRFTVEPQPPAETPRPRGPQGCRAQGCRGHGVCHVLPNQPVTRVKRPRPLHGRPARPWDRSRGTRGRTREARSPPAVQRPCAGWVLSVAEPLRARRELEAAQLYGCPGPSLTAPCSLSKAAFFRCSVSLRLAQEALCGDDGVWAAGTGRSARPSTAPRLRGTFWVRWPEAAVSNFLWSQKSWKAKKKVAVITANNLVSRTGPSCFLQGHKILLRGFMAIFLLKLDEARITEEQSVLTIKLPTSDCLDSVVDGLPCASLSLAE
ncbi:uncharacterized protein LOC112580193 [Bubalus bubalis]|uniref:uncharacterized protein LOC112580193 n=1 Tax=Bubalus bubalis TaxID=89462 RepID=UPI001D12C26C|nr:uncharacterized protein LOC112580193 [Bubalus bubalis]